MASSTNPMVSRDQIECLGGRSREVLLEGGITPYCSARYDPCTTLAFVPVLNYRLGSYVEPATDARTTDYSIWPVRG